MASFIMNALSDWYLPLPLIALWLTLLPAIVAEIRGHRDRIAIGILVIGTIVIDCMVLASPMSGTGAFYLTMTEQFVEQIKTTATLGVSCALWCAAFLWSCISS